MGKRIFHMLGRLYDLIYKIPFIGNLTVRFICRFIGFMGYHSPMCPGHFESMDDFLEFFEKMTGAAGMDVKITSRDGDQFEITLEECPYLFRRPDQVGVCEAAMDMDRTMFGKCGYDLIIKESIPRGDPVCREVFRKKA